MQETFTARVLQNLGEDDSARPAVEAADAGEDAQLTMLCLDGEWHAVTAVSGTVAGMNADNRRELEELARLGVRVHVMQAADDTVVSL